MSFLSQSAGSPLSGFRVSAPVGGSTPPNDDDAANTRGALDSLGYRRDGENTLLDDLSDFQKDNGLKVDGLMNPGGPTEKALSSAVGRGGGDAAAHAVPSGDTVDRRLRSLMEDSRYPSDPDLRDHVTRQFEKAFPGEARFDASGRMERPQAAVGPEAIESFVPLRRRQAARHGEAMPTTTERTASRDIDWSDYTEGEDVAIPPKEVNAARAAPFREAKEKRERVEAWEQDLLPGFTSGDQKSFEAEAQKLRQLKETDPEAYRMLSWSTRAVHGTYENSREAYDPIKKRAIAQGLGTPKDMDAHYGAEAFKVAMHNGAAIYARHVVTEPVQEVYQRAREARDFLTTGKADTARFDAEKQKVHDEVPEGFRQASLFKALDLGATAASYHKAVRGLKAVAAPVATVGEIADATTREGGNVGAGVDRYLSDSLLYQTGKSLLKDFRPSSTPNTESFSSRLRRLGEDILDDQVDKGNKKRAIGRSKGNGD